MKHVFHQSPMTGQLEETRDFFISAVKFTCKEYFSIRAKDKPGISISMLVIVETRCIRTLRRTVLIPCIVSTCFLLSTLYYTYTGRLNV